MTLIRGGRGDVASPGDLDAERLGLEPLAVAGLARLRGLVLAQLLAHPRALGLQHAAVEVADHALERLAARCSSLRPSLKVSGTALPPVPWRMTCCALARPARPTGCRGRSRRPSARLAEHLHVIGRRRVRLGPRHHRALLEAQCFVGHDQLRIEQQLLAQPVAGRARALRGVEAEQPRLDRLDA